MSILEQPVLLALIAAVPSFILGYLAFRRAVKVDKTTEQSGVAVAQLGAVNQIIDGLNQLIDNLQEDNVILRKGLIDVGTKLESAITERDSLRDELRSINGKYIRKMVG